MAPRRNAVKIAPDFNLYEFESPDTGAVLVNPALVEALQQLRVDFAGPITVSSGYRTPARNTDVGGVPDSHHLRGDAADLVVDQDNMIRLFQLASRHPSLTAINEGDHVHVQLHETLRLPDLRPAPPVPPTP